METTPAPPPPSQGRNSSGFLTLSRGATILGWSATLVMAAATALFFAFAL